MSESYRLSDTYRKDLHHDPGHGYGRKALSGAWVGERIMAPSSVLVHTTSNANPGTKVWNEATFLRDSPDVSCHKLIGKDGSVYVILPDNMVAWHAGTTLPQFSNSRSIGYEIHCSVGESPTTAQRDSLAEQVRQDIAQYKIEKANIETHRAAATPPGRKKDPAGWTDASFYEWRSALFEIDWQREWGDRFPYRAAWGIPQRWRESHEAGVPLGKAISDEMAAAANLTVQAFEKGAITWHPTAGTKVELW